MKFKVFLTYSYRPKQHAYTRSEINAVLEEACVIAMEDLSSLGHDVEIEYTYHLNEYGGQVDTQLIDKLSAADICVVDISDNNPNVFYELGAVHAFGKSTIMIKSAKEKDKFPVPSNVKGRLTLNYTDIRSIKGRLASSIMSIIRERLTTQKNGILSLCRSIWKFPNIGKEIPIVGPPSLTKTNFSNLNDWNYVYLDNMGDKDAIVDVSILVGRLYPSVTPIRHTSSDISRDKLEKDIIIIGGAGSNKYPGNELTSMFLKKLDLKVRNDEDCEQLIINEEIFTGEYLGEPLKSPLVRDYGFFARFSNPFNPASRTIIIFGIHTLGVIGATRIFSDHPAATKNIKLIEHQLGSDPQFYCVFPVEGVKGSPMVPTLDEALITKIGS